MGARLVNRSHTHGVAAQRRAARDRRHFRLRKKITGTPDRPRLVVTRSNRHIVAQLVDDTVGHTLVAASTLDSSIVGTSGTKSELASKTGKLLAERAKNKSITQVVFDRGGNAYHGRVAKLADAAREEGLEF